MYSSVPHIVLDLERSPWKAIDTLENVFLHFNVHLLFQGIVKEWTCEFDFFIASMGKVQSGLV